jgi:DNA-binding CsgD family transcriptional regulator
MVRVHQLSHKEELVDILKSKGLNRKQIAALLYIGPATVKTHLHNIKIKKEAWIRNAPGNSTQQAINNT